MTPTIILLSTSIMALSISVWMLNIENNQIIKNLDIQQGKNFWFQAKIEDLYEENSKTNKELYKIKILDAKDIVSKAGFQYEDMKFHSIVNWEVVLKSLYLDEYLKVDILNNIITSNYQP